MPLTKSQSEQLGEMLHDFNPNLNVNVNPDRVVATISHMQLQSTDLQTLSEITNGHRLHISAQNANLCLVIY